MTLQRLQRIPVRRMWVVAIILALIAPLVVATGSASAATPPWDGTPISGGLGPTYGESWCAPTAGEAVDTLQGAPLALMPYAAVGCTLQAIQQEAIDAGVPQRMTYSVIGQSSVAHRDIYGVVIDARETPEQIRDSDRWAEVRELATTDPHRPKT